MAPTHFLNTNIPLGEYSPGETKAYAVQASLDSVPLPGAFTLAINLYMEGGQYPIPTSGVDYLGLVEITIPEGGPIRVESPIELELLQSF